MEKPSTTPYLTTRQAAQELGVSLRTAQVWVERGLLEAWKTEGGHRRITVESVERLKKENPLLPDEISGTNAGATEKLKVLAIDDDKILARLYKLKLEAFPFPVEVLTASNAIEGLLLLGRESPDLPSSRGKPRPSPVGVAREGQGRGWIAPLAQKPHR